MRIHPQAIVSRQSELGRNVEIGPFCVVEPQVILEDECRLENHVVVKKGTRLGAKSYVCEGAVLGGLPQHVNVPEQYGGLEIGNSNVIREYCTVHCSLTVGQVTRIGNACLLMVGTHVAHDCVIGNQVILTNNVLLGGHVSVEERAYLGGGAAVHQFCRIGRCAMVGGHARVLKDAPPFVTVDGGSGLVVGLNRIGLKRAGFSLEEIGQLKEAYKVIYRRGLTWNEVIETLKMKFHQAPALDFLRFLSGGTRGFVQERRMPRGATLKLHREEGVSQAPGDEDGCFYESKAG